MATTAAASDPHEMEVFLPHTSPVSEKQITVEDTKHDFDPFQSRVLEHPVSNCGTLTHLLKSSLGTGILSMPAAFKAAGLWLGVITTILVSVVCTHCGYILVQCAHRLYYKSRKTTMSYADVAEEALRQGPQWSRSFSPIARQFVLWGVFITYFASACCYVIIVSQNINYVLFHYTNAFDKRITILLLFLPFLLVAYVPNLKYLAPFSTVANICMAVGLGITCYYLLIDIPAVTERPAIAPSLSTLPVCISVVIFAIEAIGVIMPLENNMATPKSFIGTFGVLNQGMTFVTGIYIMIGFLGYLKYGDATAESITFNLPRHEILAQAVNILIGISVFFTYGLVFYVCLDIAWNEIKHKYHGKKEHFANYFLRTVLVILSFVIAISVPQIIPFVGLIGAFCFSILGLLFPVFIEMCTFWDDGFGTYNWKLIKHAVIISVGVLALVFGSRSAIADIIETF